MRGAGGDLAICEEFAFMDSRFYFKVVVPTLLTGCAFVGITTLGDETNFVNHLISLKHPDGSMVFRVLALELVCERCRRAGLSDSCRHKMGELPYWHDEQKHRDVAMIMQDRMEDFMRETRGMQTNTMSRSIYTPDSVMALLDPRNLFDDEGAYYPYVFTAVDPAAGGSSSKFAVVSCIYDGHIRERCVIVAAEAAPYRTPQENINLLFRHLEEIKSRIPGLKNCVRVFIPESNLGFEAQHMEQQMKFAGLLSNNVCVMQEDDNRAGVRMNNQLKRMLANGLQFWLDTRSVCFHKKFFTLTEDSTAELMKKMLVDQLLNYSRILTPSRDPHAPPKERYSGKMGHGQDDLVIALQLNMTFKQRFLNNPLYAKYRVNV